MFRYILILTFILYLSDLKAQIQTPKNFRSYNYEKHFDLVWDENKDSNLVGYRIYKKAGDQFVYYRTIAKGQNFYWEAFQLNTDTFYFKILAFDNQGNQSLLSDSVLVTPNFNMSDDDWLDMVQRATFRYFYHYSLIDAARIDGASDLKIFFTIILPLSKSILITLGIFTFIGTWNDFLWPLIVMTDSSMYTLPVALANLMGEHTQDTELMMAGSVVTVVPVIILFALVQKYYISGILIGSLKE